MENVYLNYVISQLRILNGRTLGDTAGKATFFLTTMVYP